MERCAILKCAENNAGFPAIAVVGGDSFRETCHAFKYVIARRFPMD
jgi:hypothetical protein